MQLLLLLLQLLNKRLHHRIRSIELRQVTLILQNLVLRAQTLETHPRLIIPGPDGRAIHPGDRRVGFEHQFTHNAESQHQQNQRADANRNPHNDVLRLFIAFARGLLPTIQLFFWTLLLFCHSIVP